MRFRHIRRRLRRAKRPLKRALVILVLALPLGWVANYVGSGKLYVGAVQSLATEWLYQTTGVNMPVQVLDINAWVVAFRVPYAKNVGGKETRSGVFEGTYRGGKNPALEGTTTEDFNIHGDRGKRTVYTHNGRVEILVHE